MTVPPGQKPYTGFSPTCLMVHGCGASVPHGSSGGTSSPPRNRYSNQSQLRHLNLLEGGACRSSSVFLLRSLAQFFQHQDLKSKLDAQRHPSTRGPLGTYAGLSKPPQESLCLRSNIGTHFSHESDHCGEMALKTNRLAVLSTLGVSRHVRHDLRSNEE